MANCRPMPASPRIWLISLYPVRTGGDRPGRRACELRFASNGEAASEPRARFTRAHAGWVRSLLTQPRESCQKNCCAEQKSWRLRGNWPHPLRTKSTIRWKQSRTCCICWTSSRSMKNRDITPTWRSRKSRASRRSRSRRCGSIGSLPAHRSSSRQMCWILCWTCIMGRSNAAKVQTIRRYRDGAELYAFSGEMRQLFANLVGNALDAMPNGGKIYLSVRASQAWYQPEVQGVRITIADTGSRNDGGRSPSASSSRSLLPRKSPAPGWDYGSAQKSSRSTRARFAFAAGRGSRSGRNERRTAQVGDRIRASEQLRAQKCGSGTVFMLFFPFNGLSDLGHHGRIRLEVVFLFTTIVERGLSSAASAYVSRLPVPNDGKNQTADAKEAQGSA